MGLVESDLLLRRVPNRADFLEWHDDLGRWIPSAAALRFDRDGMSVFVERLLLARLDTAAQVASLGGTREKPALVYGAQVARVETIGFSTEESPNEDIPIGYAHGSVYPPSHVDRFTLKGLRVDLAVAMALKHGEPQPRPPTGA